MLWLVRFAFSKEEDEEEEHGQSVIHTSCDIFIHFFCMQLLFHMFSTLMPLEDRLEVTIEISLCMAIMQNHPLPSLYIQYYHTV